ncbi:MAG: bifunctional demethylmenaquinone methyltransferase/2-methoxy-6-polyprenyl-1,4-benzoquinol methylase UbiE [Planctomycetota bacterium]
MPTVETPRMQDTPPVDKRGERVRAMFAGVAKRYDLLNHLLSMNIDKRWRNYTVRHVPPPAGGKVLDVCTGTGDLALAYAKTLAGKGLVVGADFCHEMLIIAREKSQRHAKGVEIVEADAQQLPFPDNEFDVVSVGFGLRNVADTRAGISEMIRVARPGGKVAILEFSKPRVPVLRWLYLAYFKYLLPAVGQAISKNDHDAYHYLPASVLQFPDGQQMIDLLTEMGLHRVEAHPLTLGHLHTLRGPEGKPMNDDLPLVIAMTGGSGAAYDGRPWWKSFWTCARSILSSVPPPKR